MYEKSLGDYNQNKYEDKEVLDYSEYEPNMTYTQIRPDRRLRTRTSAMAGLLPPEGYDVCIIVCGLWCPLETCGKTVAKRSKYFVQLRTRNLKIIVGYPCFA